MQDFTLSNHQRTYFGLNLVNDTWDKVFLDDNVAAYFDGNKIVKILNYKLGNSDRGYFEYDTDLETINRKILLPQTSRGKEQKLTVARLLRIKGSGIHFSGSFAGGGIHVYDNRRNLFFIRSYYEDGSIIAYANINSWINKYIEESPADYFKWLDNELKQKRKIQKAKEGDIIAFKVSRFEYGFARILFPIFSSKNNWIFPRSLTIALYAYISDSLDIDLDLLIKKKTLPPIYILDNDVNNNEMPIIGYKPKSERDLNIPLPDKDSAYITIFHSKTDILNFIQKNDADG